MAVAAMHRAGPTGVGHAVDSPGGCRYEPPTPCEQRREIMRPSRGGGLRAAGLSEERVMSRSLLERLDGIGAGGRLEHGDGGHCRLPRGRAMPEAVGDEHRGAAPLPPSLLQGEDAWPLLAELKRRPDTHRIPVAVLTTVDDRAKGLALGADAYCIKPIERQTLLRMLTRLARPEAMRRILIVDDEEISRYVLRQHLLSPEPIIAEAATADEALRLARSAPPDVICLDLGMPGRDGYDVLRCLEADPAMRDIPIVVITAAHLGEHELRLFRHRVAAILPKALISREDTVAAVREALGARGCAPGGGMVAE